MSWWQHIVEALDFLDKHSGSLGLIGGFIGGLAAFLLFFFRKPIEAWLDGRTARRNAAADAQRSAGISISGPPLKPGPGLGPPFVRPAEIRSPLVDTAGRYIVEHRNLFLAVLVSFATLMVGQFVQITFFPPPRTFALDDLTTRQTNGPAGTMTEIRVTLLRPSDGHPNGEFIASWKYKGISHDGTQSAFFSLLGKEGRPLAVLDFALPRDKCESVIQDFEKDLPAPFHDIKDVKVEADTVHGNHSGPC